MHPFKPHELAELVMEYAACSAYTRGQWLAESEAGMAEHIFNLFYRVA